MFDRAVQRGSASPPRTSRSSACNDHSTRPVGIVHRLCQKLVVESRRLLRVPSGAGISEVEGRDRNAGAEAKLWCAVVDVELLDTLTGPGAGLKPGAVRSREDLGEGSSKVIGEENVDCLGSGTGRSSSWRPCPRYQGARSRCLKSVGEALDAFPRVQVLPYRRADAAHEDDVSRICTL